MSEVRYLEPGWTGPCSPACPTGRARGADMPEGHVPSDKPGAGREAGQAALALPKGSQQVLN